MEALSGERLHLKPEKSEFDKVKVRYLRPVIGRGGGKMDPHNVETVEEWPVS